MNHALFWAMPRVRANSQELTPFLLLVMIQTPGSHFSSPSGLSSKMVPTLAVNWRLLWALLHCHFRWFASHEISFRLQVGQITPLGQSFDTMYRMQLSASAKWRMASYRVRGLSKT